MTKNSKLNRDIIVNMLERSDLMGNIYPLATDEFSKISMKLNLLISLDGLIYILEGSQIPLLK